MAAHPYRDISSYNGGDSMNAIACSLVLAWLVATQHFCEIRLDIRYSSPCEQSSQAGVLYTFSV